MNKITTIIAVGLLIAAATDRGAAANFYVTPGVGLGSLWNSTGPAVGLTCTYRDGAPSISARLTYVQEFELFVSPPESVTELAVLAGLNSFADEGASVGFHFGLGMVRSTRRGDVIHWALFDTDYATVTATVWGPAFQVDAFIKRVGLSLRANINDSASFLTLLFSIRIGNVYGK
jgi:hypothetical protein